MSNVWRAAQSQEKSKGLDADNGLMSEAWFEQGGCAVLIKDDLLINQITIHPK